MGKRKKAYEPKPFESMRPSGEISANIYSSMMLSPVFQSLTARQKALYMACKHEYYGDTPKGDPEFTMNRYKWNEKFKLYSIANQAAFYDDMYTLIEKGFVDCVRQGMVDKKKNVYKLSSRWQHYGEADYEVPFSVMPTGMHRRFTKNKD